LNRVYDTFQLKFNSDPPYVQKHFAKFSKTSFRTWHYRRTAIKNITLPTYSVISVFFLRPANSVSAHKPTANWQRT